MKGGLPWPKNIKKKSVHGAHWTAILDEEDMGSLDAYWRYTCGTAMYPHEDAVRSFFDHLASDDFQDALENETVVCVLDAVDHWLLHREGARSVPAYEFYLQVVIHIIGIWNDEHGWRYEEFQEMLRLIPPEAPRRGLLAVNPTLAVLPTLVRPDAEVEVWNHPALSKETFEYVRRHQARSAHMS